MSKKYKQKEMIKRILAILMIVLFIGGFLFDSTYIKSKAFNNNQEGIAENEEINTIKKYIENIKKESNCMETVRTEEDLDKLLEQYDINSITDEEKKHIISITREDVLLKQLSNECNKLYTKFSELIDYSDRVLPSKSISSSKGDRIYKNDVLTENIILTKDMTYEQKQYNFEEDNISIVSEVIDSVDDEALIYRKDTNIYIETMLNNTWKPYGDRKFTNSFYLKHLLYPDTKLSLCFHYTVNENTLSARYCDTKASEAVGVVSLSKECQVTDWTADKIGHDINGVGNFTVAFLNIGIGPISLGEVGKVDYELRSRVLLDGYDRKNGEASLAESTAVYRSEIYF